MASFSEFVRFCSVRTGCDKGGLYAIQPRGLRGTPIKIGYSFNLLRRLSDWEYNYPEGIDILAVARMNRPNDTHFHKRRALQLAETLLKQELRQYVAARGMATAVGQGRDVGGHAPHRSRHLAGDFFDAAQIKAPWEHALVASGTPGRRAQPKAVPTMRRQRHEPLAPVLWPCHLRRKGVDPKCEADALRHWERSPLGRGKCVESRPAGAQTS